LEHQDKSNTAETRKQLLSSQIPTDLHGYTYQISSRQLLSHLSATKMKISKAPVLLQKAAAMCKTKTSVVAARILILSSLRSRRMAKVSQKIHALIVAHRQRVECHKALMLGKDEKRLVAVHGTEIATDLSEQLALFDKLDGQGGCPDWTFMHPLFEDEVHSNYCYVDDGDMLLDVCDSGNHNSEPSVMDVIMSIREVEGLEFNMEEEIDQAADMFIRRFRQRMNKDF
jgi:hypothetical protein